MKHLFLAVVLFAAITGSKAQLIVSGDTPLRFVNTSPNSITAADIAGRNSKHADGSVQALSWKALFNTSAQMGFHYSQFNNASTVVEFDAASGSLSIVRTDATFVGTALSSKLGVMRSNDRGANWTFDVVKDLPTGFIGAPNLAQIKTGTNPATWPVFIYGNTYGSTGANLFHNTAYYRIDGTVNELPFTSNPSGGANYEWSQADLDVDKENNSFLGVSQLGVVANSGTQYGAYGFFNFSPEAGDFVTEGIPSAWGLSKFRQISPPNVNSTLGVAPLIDHDADGRFYVAFNNMKADSTIRTVLVSTSEDGGATWSADFNMMPPSLLTDFGIAKDQDVVIQISVTPYQGSAFIVTGPNEYSYFFRVATGDLVPTDPTQFNIAHHYILEARYRAGVWSLVDVADLSIGLSIEGVRLEYPSYELNDARSALAGRPVLVVDAARRSVEIEVGKTVDGNHLIVKFLDQDPTKFVEVNPPVLLMTITDQGDTVEASAPLDTLAWTDIFLVNRAIGAATWSTPTNATNDAAFNKDTYMARDIPSLTEVPLVQGRALASMGVIGSQVPASVVEAISNFAGSVEFANASTVTGVEDLERVYAFRISNIVPNPALNFSDVTFTLDKSATVSVDLFDVMGNKVRTLVSPVALPSGPHGVSVDVSSLTAGQYHVAVTVNGNRITRSLVVVK
ncbi:MAG: T9SS type A sorting domain-containing protein [bacterium]|nr:T9SS type A sorting domain-containing protein [bacterium]